jgi:hypothetical protein
MAIPLKMFFCTKGPAKNWNFTTIPLVYRKHPRKTRGLPSEPPGMEWWRHRSDSGKPAALPAGETVGRDHMLT